MIYEELTRGPILKLVQIKQIKIKPIKLVTIKLIYMYTS